MHFRPILSESVFSQMQQREADYERRIDALEQKVARLEAAIGVATDGGVRISGPSIELDASSVLVSSSQYNVNAPMARFSSTVQCNTIIATNVVGTNYTPGAGNVF